MRLPIALLALPIFCGVAAAQPAAENAALKYLRADIALRQSYPLSPDAASKLEISLTAPLDPEDEKLVAVAGEALVEFHHGSSLKHCDWDPSAEDGPFTNTSHRGAVRELVAVAGIRARLRFRARDVAGATDDLLDALTAARHLSVDGSITSVLIAYKIERMISELLAQNLDLLSPSQLDDLSIRLDGLPGGSSLGEAIAAEKISRSDFLPIIEGAPSRDELIDRLMRGIPILQSDRSRAAEVVDGCGGSVAGFTKCVREQESFYKNWESRFGLSPEQFEAQYKAEIEPLSKANPVIRMFTPNLPRLRWAESYCQTRRALLQAAIAVRQDGPAALRQHRDPYDGDALTLTSVEGGFRLVSKLTDSGIPLSLSVAPNRNDRSGSGK